MLSERPISATCFENNYKLSDYDAEAEIRKIEELKRKREEEENRLQQLADDRLKEEELK